MPTASKVLHINGVNTGISYDIEDAPQLTRVSSNEKDDINIKTPHNNSDRSNYPSIISREKDGLGKDNKEEQFEQNQLSFLQKHSPAAVKYKLRLAASMTNDNPSMDYVAKKDEDDTQQQQQQQQQQQGHMMEFCIPNTFIARRRGLPKGVSCIVASGKYRVRVSYAWTERCIGTFSTLEQATLANGDMLDKNNGLQLSDEECERNFKLAKAACGQAETKEEIQLLTRNGECLGESHGASITKMNWGKMSNQEEYEKWLEKVRSSVSNKNGVVLPHQLSKYKEVSICFDFESH